MIVKITENIKQFKVTIRESEFILNPIINPVINNILQVTVQEPKAKPNVVITEINKLPTKVIIQEAKSSYRVVITDVKSKPIIVNVSQIGQRGAPGQSTNFSQYTAGEILGGQRVVMLQGGKVVYNDPSDENNAGKLIGITNQASLADQKVYVVSLGIITNMANLIQDEIYYADLNGTITNTPVMNGILQRIGIAIDANNLKLEFSEPLILT